MTSLNLYALVISDMFRSLGSSSNRTAANSPRSLRRVGSPPFRPTPVTSLYSGLCRPRRSASGVMSSDCLFSQMRHIWHLELQISMTGNCSTFGFSSANGRPLAMYMSVVYADLTVIACLSIGGAYTLQATQNHVQVGPRQMLGCLLGNLTLDGVDANARSQSKIFKTTTEWSQHHVGDVGDDLLEFALPRVGKHVP